MRKLVIAIGIFFAHSFLTHGQTIERAQQVNLNPARKFIYDSLFYANDWRVEGHKRNVAWFKSKNSDYNPGEGWMGKMLKVGDQMPDLEFGTVLNNVSGKIRFSDFKGKLVILDFWNTYCSSCIGAFPKMEALQRKFDDRIQIVLVNAFETQTEIEKRMGKNISKIPNLLSIVDARYLIPYFPTQGVPYHVWIDQNGKIRILGSNDNTYEKKIQDFLDGKQIDYLATEATKPSIDPTTPYYYLVGNTFNTNNYNSFFTSFNPDYAPFQGGESDVKDSSSYTRRLTFINRPIEELYLHALRNEFQASRKNVIIGLREMICYEVKDSLRYHWKFAYPNYTDLVLKMSRFCYEQIYPRRVVDEDARKMMLEDLNSYFGKLYGTHGRMEKRIVTAYVITKSPKKTDKQLVSKSDEYKEIEIIKGGEKIISYRAISLGQLVSREKIQHEIWANKKFLLNESGLDAATKLDIELPRNASIKDIKLALIPYGLDIVEKKTQVELLVISDTKAKSKSI